MVMKFEHCSVILSSLFKVEALQNYAGLMGVPSKKKPILDIGISNGRQLHSTSTSLRMKNSDFDQFSFNPLLRPSNSPQFLKPVVGHLGSYEESHHQGTMHLSSSWVTPDGPSLQLDGRSKQTAVSQGGFLSEEWLCCIAELTLRRQARKVGSNITKHVVAVDTIKHISKNQQKSTA